jgi:hypothetical protein
MWNRFIERWQSFTREQQISVVILMMCGVCALTLSLFRIQASIKEPFLVRKDSLVNTKKLLGLTEQQKIEREQRMDTDGDGLSDWDETNTYKTNPNLRDSCGDGIPDNVRIATGKDVACAGVNSNTTIDTSALKADNTLSPVDIKVPGTSLDGAVKTNSPASAAAAQGPEAFLQQMLPRDPKLIREMLKGKVDATKLQNISDEDLLKLFDAALTDQGATITDSSVKSEATKTELNTSTGTTQNPL